MFRGIRAENIPCYAERVVAGSSQATWLATVSGRCGVRMRARVFIVPNMRCRGACFYDQHVRCDRAREARVRVAAKRREDFGDDRNNCKTGGITSIV